MGKIDTPELVIPDMFVSFKDENILYQNNYITSITIPATMTSIGKGIRRVTNLQTVTIYATIPPTLSDDGGFFYGSHANIKVYVPSVSLETYKNASVYKNYASKIYCMDCKKNTCTC